jgi:hypothetical protein
MTHQTETDIWASILGQLQLQTPQGTFDSFLNGTYLVSQTDDRLVVAANSALACDWLQNRLSLPISRAVVQIAGRPLDVQFTTVAPSSPDPGNTGGGVPSPDPGNTGGGVPSPDSGSTGGDAPSPDSGSTGGDAPSPESGEGRGGGRLDGLKDSYTAYEVITTAWPEPTWAIPGLLPAGLAGFTALPKIGKSWLALQLAHAISTGGRFLGHPVQRGKFLYFALEDNVQRLKTRMTQQQWDADQRQKLNDFVVYEQFSRIYGRLDADGAEILRQRIAYYKYTLVVIDTLSWAFPGDQDRVDQMYAVLGPVKQIALAHNCCLLVIDHHNKRASSGQSLILDWLGSIGKAAITDTIWGLYREQGQTAAQLIMTGKDIQEQTIDVTFDRQTGLWSPDPSAGFQLTENRQEILDILCDLKRAKVGEIANAIEQNRGNTHKRLQALVNAGYVTRAYEPDGSVYYEPSQAYILDLPALSVNTVNTVNTGKQVNTVNTPEAGL